jgi:RNA polymerase sigma-70 factor, ECF subfamily
MTQGAPDDRSLLAAHLAGSPDAFTSLVLRYQDRLWAVALRMMRDPDDAADVLQDALVKTLRAAGTFRGDAAVSTWMHRIVVNTALDALRRRAPVLDAPEEVPDGRDAIAERDTEMDVARALAQLSAEQRAAIVLVDLQGLTVEQAAAVLECAPGTVKSRCFRGRARLADLLALYAPHPGNREAGSHVRPTEPAEPHGSPDRRDT